MRPVKFGQMWLVLAKCGLAKCGQIRMAKSGLAQCGHGLKILEAPVGSRRFVHEKVMERVDEERRLWEAIPHVPDLQCAWQILLQCAGPRCHHMLRTLPPTQSGSGLWRFCWETPWRRSSPRRRTPIGDAPHEVGRIGVEVGAARCTWGAGFVHD